MHLLCLQIIVAMKCFFIAITALILVLPATAQPVSKAVPLYRKGLQMQAQGNFLTAVAMFKKAVLADKKFDSAHLALASIYLQISKTDSAVMVLKNAVKNKPSFAAAHQLLGMTYRDYLKNSKEALVHYLNAVKYDSTDKTNWYALAWCSNDLKNYNDAVRYAIKALDIDNSYRPAYNELGHAYRQLGTYKDCIETFKKRLDISINEQPLYYSGLCYIELKDKEGALHMYNELVKIQSKSAEPLKKRIDAMQ